MLKTVTNKFNKWFLLPARGLSGGFLIGCNNSYFICHAAWLICGHFNVIHFKHKKSGPNFVARASNF
jgi:hypothetical protein